MTYQIQQKSSDVQEWTKLEHQGDDLKKMQTAVNELIVAAKMNQSLHSYRLVDENGEVVYSPTDEEVGWPAETEKNSETDHDSLTDIGR